MEGTVVQTSLQAEQRIAGDNTVLHLLLDTLLNGRNVFLRNRTTNDFVDEYQTFFTFISRGEFQQQRDRTDHDHQTAWQTCGWRFRRCP